MRQSRLRIGLKHVLVLSLVGSVLTPAAQQSRVFVLSGHAGELAVVEMGGRAYVEIEALTRLVNGSLSFKGNQIVLTLPSFDSHAPKASAETNPPGFTKEFLKAGIEQLSVIREWRRTLISAVERGYPVTEDWMTSFSNRAQDSLRLVSLAASSESDRSALQLLRNEFNNMKTLSDRFVAANRSRIYIPTDALDNDPLDQRILSCGRSLAAMAANNQFVDDGLCR